MKDALQKILKKPRIDVKRAASLRAEPGDGKGTLLDELMEIYLGELPGRLKAIHGAISSSDLRALNSMGHLMKSSSGSIGMDRVSQICELLEHLKVFEEGEIKEAVTLLEKEIDASCKELKKL